MYIPEVFEESDVSVLHALVREHPLGTWVTQGAGELTADHVPFILDADRGPYGTLRGHVARANRVWQALSSTAGSLVVFQGPQGYVTPSWYPTKHVRGEVVPTWNYAVVHAHGPARAVHDRGWLLSLVTDLTAEHERARAVPWTVADAPPEFVDRLLRSIVGIEIPIERLVGKWKVSQNRPETDRLGVASGLEAEGDAESKAMALLVRRRLAPDQT
ncbi:MAG TPA: FMN-binding negative transcriptional regulator [Thermoanaerobaculia bacterium]|nr:FMN-binding negative transcriptional regulator [Thermoanaerobaculia bacterium]